MGNKFRNWYITHFPAINWFLIGLLTANGLDQLGEHNYSGAAISFGLAYLNFLFRDKI